MWGFKPALGAALGLMALTAAADAQEADARRVRAYLEHGLQRHAALGFAPDPTNVDIAAPLALDRPFVWPVYLVEGRTYRIYAACDDNCADLDMEVYGADGHLVDRDIARDDTPYVQITAARSARAYVRIWLYDCQAERCYAAARVTTGGTPAPRDAEPASTDDNP